MKKMIIELCLLCISLIYAQVDTVWVKIYNGSGNGNDQANALVVDGSGNVYVTGSVLSSNGYRDIATIKYSTAGVPLWVRLYDGPSHFTDDAFDIAIDDAGNVYITGRSHYGPTIVYDYVTIKYDSNGILQWVQTYNGPGSLWDEAHAIALDEMCNVYVTGRTVSTGYSGPNCTTIKYDSSGVEQWVMHFSGTTFNDWDEGRDLATDNFGNIYVAAYGDRFYLPDSNVFDYVVIKYDSVGVQQWVARYHSSGGGDSRVTTIAVDDAENVYITGTSFDIGTDMDCATIKYNTDGDTLWVRRYNGNANGYDRANALAVDDCGNVYITGQSDRDTNPDVNRYDYATVKYDSAGVQQWVVRYNAFGNGDHVANALALDDSGNVYVTGYSADSDTVNDYATIKYDAAGELQWVIRYNGPADTVDVASSIAVDDSSNVYVTGWSIFGNWGYDYTTIKYIQSATRIEESLEQTLHLLTFTCNPNPVHKECNIRYALTKKTNINISIFDVTGRPVREIINEIQNVGSHSKKFNISDLAQGVYFIKFNTDNHSDTKKIILIK